MVAGITDGDTIKVRRRNRTEDVRLIGIDTPEVYFGVECGGEQASASMEGMLSVGNRVRLIRDRSQDNRDAYGRLLRYVERMGRSWPQADPQGLGEGLRLRGAVQPSRQLPGRTTARQERRSWCVAPLRRGLPLASLTHAEGAVPTRPSTEAVDDEPVAAMSTVTAYSDDEVAWYFSGCLLSTDHPLAGWKGQNLILWDREGPSLSRAGLANRRLAGWKKTGIPHGNPQPMERAGGRWPFAVRGRTSRRLGRRTRTGKFQTECDAQSG